MLIITSAFASVLTFIYIKLALNVISLRGKNQISLGSGGVDELERAIRTHGNFSEYVPISLILMGCLELNHAPWWLVSIFGLSLTIGRVLHSLGMTDSTPNFTRRILGMKLTLTTLVGLACLNLGWLIFNSI